MSRFTLITPASKTGRVYKSFKKDDQNVITREKEALGVYHTAEYRDFANFQEMCDILFDIEESGNTCIVRGDISAVMEARALGGIHVRRTKFQRKDEPAGFQPAVRDWILVDVDKYELSSDQFDDLDPSRYPEACVKFILSKLPHYFQGVSCWWQFSASQSVMIGSRTVSIHLFYMIDRTVSDVTLRRWAEGQKLIPKSLPIDPNVFDCIQPHYIAIPRFINMKDPLPVRSGIFEGDRTRVIFDVPEESADEFIESGGNIHPLINMKKLKPYLDLIGDDPGRLGFNDAIKSVVGRYFQLYGHMSSDLPLKSAVRQAVQDAPLKHDRPMTGPQSLEWYLSEEYLDPLIRNIRDKEQVTRDAEADVYMDGLKRYVYITDLDRFMDMSTGAFRQKTGINDEHAFEYEKIADNMLTDSNLRRVNRITYKPGAPDFCEDFDPDTGKVFRAYNRFTPPSVELQNEVDAKWFVDHIDYLCDGEGAAVDAILSWCAHLVQFPAEKLNFGVLMQGMQGTGKSALTEVMSRVLGPSNVSGNVTTQYLMSDFTEWMQGKMLICCEEIKDKEDKFRMYNQLKHFVTGPSIRVNPKGLPSFVIPNRANFMCFTNYEDAVPMDDDDRRFIIHFSQAIPQSDAYYPILFERIEKYAGAVRSLLLHRDLTNFSAKGRAPMTSSKREYLQMNGTPLERWLRESIDGDMFPCEYDIITLRDLRRCLPAQFNKVSEMGLSIALRKAGAKKRPSQARLPHGKLSIWTLRNHKDWEEASEEKINKYYMQPIGDHTGNGTYQKPTSGKMPENQKEY